MGLITRATRNISRRKVRALLVIIALGFSMAIMISIPAGITANQASTELITQNLSNTITQTEETISQTLTQIDCSLDQSFSGFGFTSSEPIPGSARGPSGGGSRKFGGGVFSSGGSTPMNETLYEDIGNIPQVTCVTPILQVVQGQDQMVTSPSGREFTLLVADYVIEGVPLISNIVENYPIIPSNITSGRNLQADDFGVVLVSESTAEFFEAGVGDIVTILEQPFEVIGVFGSSGVEDVNTLYMNLSDAQSLTDNEGLVTSLAVFTESGQSVTEVAETIYGLHPELSIVTSQDRLEQLELLQGTYESQLETAEASLAQTEAMAVQEIGLAIVGTSLIVLFVMLYTVRERTKEIGTLKAIGFSNQNILSQFMLEGIILSFIAGLVGIGIGIFATPIFSGVLLPAVNAGVGGTFTRVTAVSSVSVSLTAELVLMGLGGALLLGVIGSLYPAWKASRTSPMEALKYE